MKQCFNKVKKSHKQLLLYHKDLKRVKYTLKRSKVLWDVESYDGTLIIEVHYSFVQTVMKLLILEFTGNLTINFTDFFVRSF